MTEDRAFKKAVREHMAKHDVPYSVAHRAVTALNAEDAANRALGRRGTREYPLLVFVSSRMNDDHERVRDEAIAAIEDLSTQPWAFELIGPSGQPPQELYLQAVERCDIFIWLSTGTTTTPVAEEVRHAITVGKTILAFVIPDGLQDDLTRELITAVQGVAVTDQLKSVDDVYEAVSAAIIDEATRRFRLPQGVPSASPAALSPLMDPEEFEAAVADLIEAGRSLTLHRFIEASRKSACATDAHAHDAANIIEPDLDALGHLGILAVTWNQPQLLRQVIDALVAIFQRAHDSNGLADAWSRIQWMEAVAATAYAIAAAALRTERWDDLRTIIDNPATPRPDGAWNFNWFEAARLRGAKKRTDGPHMSSLNLVLAVLADKPWANPKAPFLDPLREEIVQVDALASICLNAHQPKHQYYPSYRGYEPEFYEAILIELINDPNLRKALALSDDRDLADTLIAEAGIDVNTMASLTGQPGYRDGTIRTFLTEHRSRR